MNRRTTRSSSSPLPALRPMSLAHPQFFVIPAPIVLLIFFLSLCFSLQAPITRYSILLLIFVHSRSHVHTRKRWTIGHLSKTILYLYSIVLQLAQRHFQISSCPTLYDIISFLPSDRTFQNSTCPTLMASTRPSLSTIQKCLTMLLMLMKNRER